MKKLTLQEALFKDYTQFFFRKQAYDLNEKNLLECHKSKKEDEKLFLIDPDISYEIQIIPEEVLYNATESLYSGCFDKVLVTKNFKTWKDQTEKFVEDIKEITKTFNVTDIELIN